MKNLNPKVIIAIISLLTGLLLGYIFCEKILQFNNLVIEESKPKVEYDYSETIKIDDNQYDISYKMNNIGTKTEDELIVYKEGTIYLNEEKIKTIDLNNTYDNDEVKIYSVNNSNILVMINSKKKYYNLITYCVFNTEGKIVFYIQQNDSIKYVKKKSKEELSYFADENGIILYEENEDGLYKILYTFNDGTIKTKTIEIYQWDEIDILNKLDFAR